MATRFTVLLISLLVLGFAVTGCGDDDDSSDSSGSGDTSSQESTKEDSAGGDGEDTPGLGGEAGKRAVEQCKTAIEGQTQLSDDVRADLEEICEEAASGDEDAVRKAAKDVCVKIVEETAPEGPARDRALEACDQAIASP